MKNESGESQKKNIKGKYDEEWQSGWAWTEAKIKEQEWKKRERNKKSFK
jgi:hypothetical protein